MAIKLIAGKIPCACGGIIYYGYKHNPRRGRCAGCGRTVYR